MILNIAFIVKLKHMDRCYLILKVNVIELLITFYQITEARSETRNELLRVIDHKPIKMLN